MEYDNPSKLGLYGSRNFYLTHKDPEEDVEVKLGLWHVLPRSLVKYFQKALQIDEPSYSNFTKSVTYPDLIDPDEDFPASNRDHNSLMQLREKYNDADKPFKDNDMFEELLRKVPGKIVLYLHGNSGNRGAPHRVELYQLLQSLDCHVITLDYRSYGDSSAVPPSEMGVIRDSLMVYNYIKGITNNPVFLWGHSLGTGIGTHLLSILQEQRVPGPQAVVLESPFNNIREEIREHPMSKLFRHLPWFDALIVQPMYNNNLRFESDSHIGEFRQPILILHAEDDLVVPFKLGYKLYRKALDVRGKAWGPVEFHRFEYINRFGHKFICRAKNLPKIVLNFFDAYQHERY